MASDPKAAASIAALLGVAVDRILDLRVIDRTDDRWVERVRWSPASGGPPADACAKHGPDPRLAHEAAVYAGLLAPDRDPVPEFLGYAALAGGTHLLITRWLPGRPADFSSPADVASVFGALGRWLAGRAVALAAGAAADIAPRRPLPSALEGPWRHLRAARDATWFHERLTRMVDRALALPNLLVRMGRPEIGGLYGRIGALAPRLAERIAALPLTTDPGDITPENTLLCAGGVRFLDFEYAAIAPASVALANLDEPWDTAARGTLAELALEVFLGAWAAADGPALGADTFASGHRCGRLFKTLCELDDILVRLADGDMAPEELAVAHRYTLALPAVAAAALAGL